jgi:hypothetical protein
MKNQINFNLQIPFDGHVVNDEKKLKELFGDEYESLVKLENDLKGIDPNYFGKGIPFVTEGFFFKYPEGVKDKIWMITTTGEWKYILKSDFENQVNQGKFDGLPMHRGHTNYPEDQTEFKEPFGSSIKTEIKTQEGGYGYYYILPSEGKLRKDLAASATMGFQKAPLRDLSSQFISFALKNDPERIVEIDPSSIDLVYKTKAFMKGSGFQAIIANQKPNIEEENIMERKDVLNSLTIEEMQSNENAKALIAKMQEDARKGYVRKEDIVKTIEEDSDLRGEVVKCQKVVDDLKSVDAALKKKKDDFEKKGLEFLQQKNIPEEKAKSLIAEFGENMDYDPVKLQDWYAKTEKLGFQFKDKGNSNGEETQTQDHPGISEKALIDHLNSL